HPVRQPGPPGRRLRDPHGGRVPGHPVRDDHPGRGRRRARHRGVDPTRHWGGAVAGNAGRVKGEPMRAPFGALVTTAVSLRGPLCVGIDPHPGLLEAWGLPVSADGLERFAMTCVEALAPEIAVLKPQSAFFEAFGSRGVAVLEQIIAAGRAAGALVVVDAKRGDIGSTMAAYAEAYLGDDSPLAGDAVTLSPYLGFGSLQPA